MQNESENDRRTDTGIIHSKHRPTNKERKEKMNTKIWKSIMTAGMALSLAACGSSSAAASASTTSNAASSAAASTAAAAVGDGQTILIGISPDYPPFDDLTTDGQLTGFDYDMGEWIFNWLNENGYNYKHEWKQMSFDTIISSIQADQIDLGISGFTYAEDRKVLFSDPYYESAQVALVPDDSPLTSTDELAGKTLGCQLGSTGQTVAEEVSPDNTAAVKDMGVAIETLKAGGYDAVILDISVAKNYVAAGGFKMLDGKLLDESCHIIAKEGNTELMDAVNKALAAFLDSDDYNSLKEQYGIE